MPCVVDVDNRVVSVILNEYAQIAKAARIHLTLDIQIPYELPITAADLYVIIGNTMDNAIECCEMLPEENRRIKIKLRSHNAMTYYEITNPSFGYSVKPKKGFHGYGLSNVNRCVQKYHGVLTYQDKDGMFSLVAQLNNL